MFIIVWLAIGFIILLIISIIKAKRCPIDTEVEKREAKKLMDTGLRRQRWYDSHPF